MSKQPKRPPLRSCEGRLERVGQVLQQWRAGLPLRTAAKVLRKVGIHPWSLVVNSPQGGRDRLLEELRVPDFFGEAIRHAVGFGLNFFKVQGPLRLPAGLVVSSLFLVGCPDVQRLPRRLWASGVGARECARLDRLHLGGGRVLHLVAERCPRLRDAGLGMMRSGIVRLLDCPMLRVLPNGPRISSLILKDLPLIRALPGNLQAVDQLSLWRLPQLQDLSCLTVNRRLLLQECRGLRLLPQVGTDIRGSVLDCPALVDQVFPLDANGLLMAPAQASAGGAEIRPIPRSQQVEPVPLAGLCEPKCLTAWPWPPDGFPGSGLDGDIDRTGRALGMGPQERLKLHVAAGASPACVVRGLMLQAADPAEAVHLGAGLLSAALVRRDLRGALEVCLGADQLGLGALSLALTIRSEQQPSGIGLDAVLGPFWGPRARRAGAPSFTGRLQWHDAESIPGPLVLTRWANISQNTSLRWIDGPVWSAQSLWITDCPRLEKLPELIVAKAGLTIESCLRLVSFPRRLDVQGDLTLLNLPRLWAQVCRIRVGGKVRVEGCPGLTLLALDNP